MEEFFEMQVALLESGVSTIKVEYREKIPRGTLLEWGNIYITEFLFSERARSETDLRFTMVLEDVENGYSRHGISFAGILTWDLSHRVRVGVASNHSIHFATQDYGSDYDRVYIEYHSGYGFRDIGVYLKYSMRKEYINGSGYWVITLYPIIIPNYMKLYDTMEQARVDKSKVDAPMPPDYDRIAWKISIGRAEFRYIKVVTGKDLMGKHMYIDELRRSGVHVNTAASLENLFYDLVDVIMDLIDSKPAGFFFNPLTLIDYADSTASTSTRNLMLKVSTEQGYMPPDSLRVNAYKYTINPDSMRFSIVEIISHY